MVIGAANEARGEKEGWYQQESNALRSNGAEKLPRAALLGNPGRATVLGRSTHAHTRCPMCCHTSIQSVTPPALVMPIPHPLTAG